MSTRSLMLIPLGLLLPACLAGIDTSLIKEDGSTDTAMADQAVAHDGPRPDGPRPDGHLQDGPKPDQLPDTVPAPESTVQDLPTGVCTKWSAWSCTTTPATAVGSCTVSGTTLFTLVCNKASCSCTRTGGSTKVCSSATNQTCTNVQQAFNAGCCAGL